MNKTNETNNERHMKKILIVEDDQNIAKALAIRLRSAGYEVIVAPDAMIGVATAVKFQPDLALLDISVPAGSGFTVAEKIQELVVTSTPIIFLTASKQPGLRQQAENLGAAGFFEKPYDADELLAAIKHALSENEVTKQ
jgi:DNA-binding response OmpR family regulator